MCLVWAKLNYYFYHLVVKLKQHLLYMRRCLYQNWTFYIISKNNMYIFIWRGMYFTKFSWYYLFLAFLVKASNFFGTFGVAGIASEFSFSNEASMFLFLETIIIIIKNTGKITIYYILLFLIVKTVLRERRQTLYNIKKKITWAYNTISRISLCSMKCTKMSLIYFSCEHPILRSK